MNINEIKKRIFSIIEPSDESNVAGRVFDLSMVALIIVNLVLIIADTFQLPDALRTAFAVIEFLSVIIYTVEYVLRVWTADLLLTATGKSNAKIRIRYMFTFMALIDLLSILPFYIPFIIPLDLRVLRTLRIFRLLRLFKVNRHLNAFSEIGEVFKKKLSQLLSSMLVVFLLMVITSVLMYNVEHAAQPDKFDNAFSSFWWAMATLTTIGYGDIYPITIAGKILNGIFAFLSIGLVAIPTGIISAGFIEYFAREKESPEQTGDEKCFCPYCGHKLDRKE